MKVDRQTTFSQIQAEFKPNILNKNEAIRAKDGFTELKTHSKGLRHGSGQAAANERATKIANGAAFIRASIAREHGSSVANRVFQNVGRDLSGGVTPSHLAEIGHTINQLKMSDAGTAARLTQLGGAPFDRDTVKELLTIAQDTKAMSPANRNTALTLLRTAVMNATADQRTTALSLPPPAVNPTARNPDRGSIEALFTAQRSDGSRAFSLADLCTITTDAFADETPRQTSQSFFRGNTPATMMLSCGLAHLDGDKLHKIGQGIVEDGKATIAQAKSQGTALTATVEGKQIGNPTLVNRLLGQIDNRLTQVAQTPELHTFMQAVKTSIDNAPPPAPWTGQGLLTNAIVLRGLNGGAADIAGKTLPSDEAKVVIGALTAMMQAANFSQPYAATSAYSVLNPGLTPMLAPGSGYNTLLATVP